MYTKKICFLLLAFWALLAQNAQAQCNGTPPIVQIDPPGQITCQSPTVQLTATVTPPTGDYSYSWSGTVSNPGNLTATANGPGVYALFVLDSATGCWGGDTVIVTQDGSFPQVTIQVEPQGCNDPTNLVVQVAGGTGPYTYAWSTGENTQTIQAMLSPSGVTTYCVTVTDMTTGCTSDECAVVTDFGPLSAEIIYFDSQFCDDSIGMWVNVSGGAPPFTYSWNNGNTSVFIDNPAVGTYVVTVTGSNGCSVVSTYVVEDDPNECAELQGYVWADWNTNCTVETSDDGLANIPIQISNAAGLVFYAVTDANGFYSTEIYPGTYDVTVLPPNNLWTPCQATYSISLTPSQTVDQDFLLQPEAVCPAMSVDISTNNLRRCFLSTYYVNYCNQGTVTANGAYVEIQFDPFLSVNNSSIPGTDLGNNLYRFDLGDVPFNTCGSFWVKVLVSCDATLGQTHCTEAVIYPTGSCEAANPQWSGASLELTVDCNGDSLDFVVRNTGVGTMSAPLEYVIIEDAVMLMQAPPPAIYLAPAQEHHIKVPANGATWRVEVAQEEFHPGNSQPAAWAEGCTATGQFSTGFVNQFPAGDNDPWVDIDCRQNTGSYDPNDKQGFPVGYSTERYIEKGTDIEYLIRFQNTGTDTAFTVVIRDQLSPWLDPGSVRPGASSHPYKFEYYGDRDIKFTFENILLPDSSTNLEGSQGFVSFRIAQNADVQLETEILNNAGIYFDFNEPVITNTTKHRVGTRFITVSSWQPFRSGLDLRVMPNPIAQQAVLELRGATGLSDWQIDLRDATGRPVRSATVSGSQWHFERGDLPAGIYLIQVRAGGAVLGAGKLMLK